MSNKRPRNKKEIQAEFERACTQLGDLEQRHFIAKAQIVAFIQQLNIEADNLAQAEKDEAQKREAEAQGAEAETV